ncbi:MAG TPA: type 2 isopentenyl-diphosphate Delta-isomerase [Candidatus Thermoplasmatota archaeon]|nr:type 2 isopentenyl-diphosphate Delta-isomerase [Candidatus Thermoplasmatota archaeon]
MATIVKDEASQTRSRKQDHVDIILKEDVRARRNAWDEVTLLHEAVPDVDLEQVDLRTRFLKKEVRAPIMIASMTGGYPDAERINGNLAAAAAEHGVAMGVGSQRAALLSPASKRSFTILNDHDVPFVCANIGAPQLILQQREPLRRDQIDELVKMIEADALIIHLNALQEAVQPEGDLKAQGLLDAMKDLSKDLGVPVIAKETGAGISRGTATRLKDAGVAALDVGGLSGTTFAAVETFRAHAEGRADRERIGALFRDWGIATPVALLEANVGLPLVATGGHRSGLDAARALALGATLAGFASAILTPANESAKAASAFLSQVELELRTACFLTGSAKASDLVNVPVMLSDELARWAGLRGLDMMSLARRAPKRPEPKDPTSMWH